MNALIDWFARNSVAANLLMIFIILLRIYLNQHLEMSH